MARIIEIRTYALHPGAAEEYEHLFDVEAAPLLAHHGTDVVAYGSSIGYYLIRAFDDLGHRQRSEDAFYGSAEWRHGSREAAIALIESYLDLVLELDEPTIDGMRRTRR